MKQEHKIYAALGVLVVLGGLVYVTRSSANKEAEEHTVTAAGDLPVVKPSAEDAEKITKFVISSKSKEDDKKQVEVTLEKKGDKWVVTKPIEAAANQANIKSLIENIQKIELSAIIADTADVHEKYELDDKNAVHAKAFKGGDVVFEMFFGKSGSRGQMARLPGKDTVYAAKGYSSYLWARELKNWRDNEILTLDDTKVVDVSIENKNGKFSFVKDGDKWTAKFGKRDDKTSEVEALKDIERFDENRVKDMLRAYKALKSTDFAGKDDETGIDDPLKNEGGIVVIKLKDKAEHQLKIGKKQEGTNRFLAKEGDSTVYVVSSWAAEWGTSGVDKFQKPEDKDKKGDGAGGGDHGEDDGHGHGKDDKKGDAKKDDKKGDAKKEEAPKGDAKKGGGTK
jgi:hypothetical protein